MTGIVCIRDRNGEPLVGGVEQEVFLDYPSGQGRPKTVPNFQWGYGGRGPKELSLNILYAYSDRDISFARAHYVEFMNAFVRDLPRSGGMILHDEIREWIAARGESRTELAER